MKIIYVILLTILTCSSSWAIKQQRTPPGSFLKYRATTVQELTNQIKKDPIIQARYSKHFHKSVKDMLTDLSNGICLISIKNPVKVTSFYISKSGKIYSKQKLLPRGTLVFANSKGIPIIAWSCGNPLTTKLPKHVAPVSPIEEKTTPAVEEIVTPMETPAPIAEYVIGAPEEIIAPAVPLEVVSDAVEIAPVVVVPPESFDAMLLVPAFAAVIPLTDKGRKIYPPAVPEPNSIIVLGSLVSLLFLRTRQKTV